MSAHQVPDDFGRLVEDNYRRVYAIIYRLLGDRQEAEDLTQDTFVKAYRAREGFRGDSSPVTWLCRIAINLTRNRLEQLRRRPPGASLSASPGEVDWADRLADPRGGPVEELHDAEMGRRVAHAVLRLAPEYREVVLLREYEDLSYEEIAVWLGLSVPAVKSRLFRARALLRQRLAPYLEDR